MTGHTARLVAIVPVGSLERAKSRLGGALDPEERHDLVASLLEGTLEATAAARGVADTLVVTPDPEVEAIARAGGARAVRQADRGLNRGLDEARRAALADGATAILVLPGDLPGVTAAAVDELIDAIRDTDEPVVALVPDRHGRGTNALLLAPPAVIEFAFGGDSRAAHRHAAGAAGARLIELGGPLALDVDTPDDLLLAQAAARTAADARAGGPAGGR